MPANMRVFSIHQQNGFFRLLLLRQQFHPQHPLWYEDLAPRSSPIDKDQDFDGACFNEDVRVVDENHIEISRESSFTRGGGILCAIFWLYFLSVQAGPAIFRDNFTFFKLAPFEAAFGVCVLIAGTIALLKLLYLDLRVPRDTPIRFNRKTPKFFCDCFDV